MNRCSKLLEVLQKNPDMTRAGAQDALSVSDKTLRRQIAQGDQGRALWRRPEEGRARPFSVVEIPEPQTVLPSPEEIFTNLSVSKCPMISKPLGEKLKHWTMAFVQEMSNCPKGEGESRAGIGQLDNTGQRGLSNRFR